MKILVGTLALLAGMAAALAQGKVTFGNNGSSLVIMGQTVYSGDESVAGQPVATSGPALPSGVRLSVGLYVGTSSSSLALVTTTATSPQTASPLLVNPPSGGSGVNGQWAAAFYEINGFTGTVFLQVKVWDSSYVTYEAQFVAYPFRERYSGTNNIWQMTLGSSITYPNMYSAGGSTWAAVGNNSPIVVSVSLPEPGPIALASLGVATMLISGRRK
jgi:hypothetical protein